MFRLFAVPTRVRAYGSLFIVLVFGLFFTISINAQPLAAPVVVTATRTPQSAVELVSDVSTIDEHTLRTADSVVQALRSTSGVQISQQGGPGLQQDISLRGANNQQTLSLVEGFRMGTLTFGQANFAGLAPAHFARAEVLRGSSSGLYGSDAIGGVVQFFLPRGTGTFAPTGEISIGSQQSRAGWVGVGGGNDLLDLSLRIGEARSQGLSATNARIPFGYDPDRDGYRRNHQSLQLNLRPASGHEIGVIALADQLNAQYDETGGSPAVADDRALLTTQLVGLRSQHALNDAWTLKLRAGESRDESRNISDFGGRFDSKQQQYGAELQWQSTHWQVMLGAEQLQQSAKSTLYNAGRANQRTQNALRLSAYASLNPHLWQFSLRHEDDSLFGSVITGGLHYGYRFTPQWRVGGGMHTGYRAPSFNDLYAFGGNPRLRPEYARQAEVGVYYNRSAEHAKLVLYRTHMNDLIASDANFNRVNIGRATIRGVSAEWQQRWDDVTLRLALDYLDPRDDNTGKLLARRARWTSTIALEQQRAAWRWAIEWWGTGHRFDNASNAANRRLGGAGVVNLRTSYAVTGNWEWFARIDNVFDKRYETVYGYNSSGMAVYTGLRYTPR